MAQRGPVQPHLCAEAKGTSSWIPSPARIPVISSHAPVGNFCHPLEPPCCLQLGPPRAISVPEKRSRLWGSTPSWRRGPQTTVTLPCGPRSLSQNWSAPAREGSPHCGDGQDIAGRGSEHASRLASQLCSPPSLGAQKPLAHLSCPGHQAQSRMGCGSGVRKRASLSDRPPCVVQPVIPRSAFLGSGLIIFIC